MLEKIQVAESELSTVRNEFNKTTDELCIQRAQTAQQLERLKVISNYP